MSPGVMVSSYPSWLHRYKEAGYRRRFRTDLVPIRMFLLQIKKKGDNIFIFGNGINRNLKLLARARVSRAIRGGLIELKHIREDVITWYV